MKTRYDGINPHTKYAALSRVVRLAANFVDAHDYAVGDGTAGPADGWELVARFAAYLADVAADPAARLDHERREEK